MNILVCGVLGSVTSSIVTLLIYLITHHNNIKTYHVITNENIFDEMKDINILESNNFWKVYPFINRFDVVILCTTDCSSQVCKTSNQIMKYNQNVQCWKLFSTLTLKYEEFGYLEIMKLFNVLDIPICCEKIHLVYDKMDKMDKMDTIKKNMLL